MKTYFVTGGAGFIGSNFVLYILNKYKDVRVINIDALTYAGNLENLKSIQHDNRHIFTQVNICDKDKIKSLFEEYDPDYVINFAAESHVDRSIRDPFVFANTNVMGTITLLNSAMQHWTQSENDYRGKKFLQVSTDEVYGSLSLDRRDEYFNEDTPLDPHSPYSASKAAADMFVKAYGDTYSFPVNITRCSNNYGPFQFPEKLIPLMINNAIHHKELPVYGDGLNVRDWLYVEDHCKAIDLVIQRGKIGEIYNVGGHNERANVEIVKTIIKECSLLLDDLNINDSLITYVEDRKGHDKRYGIAPDKIKRDLGWYPETPFEIGIKKTIKWYLENKEWISNVTNGGYQEYYKTMYGL